MQEQLAAAQQRLARHRGRGHRRRRCGDRQGQRRRRAHRRRHQARRLRRRRRRRPGRPRRHDRRRLPRRQGQGRRDGQRGARPARRRAGWPGRPARAASSARSGQLGSSTGACTCTKAWSRTSSTSSAGCPASGPKSAQRIAFHLLQADAGRRTPPGRRADRGQGEGAVLLDLLQRLRGGAVPDLPRPAARPDRALRGRGVQGRRRDRAHPRVPGPLPRARRRDLADRRHRTRAAAGPRADDAARRRHGHRADPGHRPQPRGRGDRHLPHPYVEGPRPHGDPAGQRAAGRRRPGVRRRGHPRTGLAGRRSAR